MPSRLPLHLWIKMSAVRANQEARTSGAEGKMETTIFALLAVWFAVAALFGVMWGAFVRTGAGVPTRQPVFANLRSPAALLRHTTRRAA